MRTNKLLLASLLAALSLVARTGSADPVITSVVETGGDNEATDTVPAKWTGVTFVGGIANEPVPGLAAGASYTVGLFGNHAPSFVDRNHRFTNASPDGLPLSIPAYLVGQEYIMSGNDNRDNNPAYTLDITVSVPVIAYMLIDNRLGDPNSLNTDPPSFGPTKMQWILDDGWTPVITGVNRAGNPTFPDELAIDEGADGTINQWYSIYSKKFAAGTFRVKQPDNAGQNMYGVVVARQPWLVNTVQMGRSRLADNPTNFLSGANSSGEYYTITGGGNDTWDRWDELAFAYHELCGDFDVKVQVSSIEASGQWSKAGIMVRENLAEDSKRFMQSVSPCGPTLQGVNGACTMETLWRTGINNVNGENGGAINANVASPQYPNAWIRVTRVGSVMAGYVGTDGVNWTLSASQDTATWQGGALPSTVQVGLSVSRHPSAGKDRCTTVFTNYVESFPTFCVGGVDSKGCPGKIFVCYTHPVGAGALDPNNYVLDPSPGIIETVTPGPTPNVVCLNLEVGVTLTEGQTYTVNVSGVSDSQGNQLGQCAVSGSFIHGAGYELRRIHLQHNRIDGANTDFYEQTLAYTLGQGAWSFGRPPFEGNTLFEDLIPDQGDIERYSTKILGVLTPAADGVYRFACSSDDFGKLFLSSDDKPAHKVLIAREPEWNGRRQYATADRRSNYPQFFNCGNLPNQSCPQNLLGNGKYYLEYIYAEGGGGNNGSATWDAGTGAAFVADQSPLEEANFTPSRYAYNEIFYTLGDVVITKHPQPATAAIGGSVTFDVCLDGTPPYQYQWTKNGTPIPGANGKTYTIIAGAGDNGAQFAVCVTNACGTACSSNALVNVALNPRITNCTSRGNCHVVYVQYNKPMNLDGVYTVTCSNTVDGLITPLVVTGIRHGRTSNEVCLAITPDLLPDTNVYCVTVLGATSTDGLIIDPNPSTCCFIHGADFPMFQVLIEQYNDVGNGNLAAFMASAKFINHQPDAVYNSTGFFETPTNIRENYGSRIFGYYIAPQAGNYHFWMASDDNGASYIATDANPANKVLMNREPTWAGVRNFQEAQPGQADPQGGRGVPPVNGSPALFPSGFSLAAGQKVYLEGLFSEGGGGDNYALAVRIDDTTVPPNGSLPIANDQFMSMRRAPDGAFFTALCDVFCNPGPSDQKAFLGDTPTFSVTPDGTPPYSIQWLRNGSPIPGANSANYTLPPVTFGNLGDVYTARISNEFSTNQCSAALNICSNPVVRMCMTWNHPSKIFVKYNKEVRLDGTYTVDDGSEIQVQSIGYGSSMSEVVVNTDPIPPDRSYVLKIEGVTDLDGNPILPDPTLCPFSQGPGRFCADFNDNQLPPGTISSGTTPPFVQDGVLHLTDRVNSQANYWTVPVAPQTFECFKARWRTLIEGVGGADGISFTIGQNVGTGFTPEEGGGNGLAVCVDTFNNGAGDAGLDIKYNGAVLVHLPVPAAGGPDGSGAPAQLAIGQFVDTSVEVTPGGLVTFSYASFTISAQIPGFAGLTANQYVFAARTGGANENAWIDDLCINDYALGDVLATLPDCPTNAVPECSSVKLTASVTGSPCYWYQWCKNGTPIPGATNAMYLTPPLSCPQDQGAVFAVKVRNHFSTNEARWTASIDCDLIPPTVVSVGSLNGQYIGVTFSECVTAASATDPANYTVTDASGSHPITPPIVLRPDGKSVIICVTNPTVCGQFRVTASNIVDCCHGNVGGGTGIGLVLGLSDVRIGTPGDPAFPATVFTSDPNPADGMDIDVTAGGTDVWGTADHGQFVYTPALGDFDMKVQVARLETVNTWSKAGLDARLSLDAAAPHVMTVFTPFGPTQDGSGPGADGIDAGARQTPGGDTVGWGGKGAPTLSAGQNWLRLVRTGNQFLGYWSADGVNWTQHADTGVIPGLPAQSFIGLITTSHNNGAGLLADAEYRNFMITPFGPCGLLSIRLEAASPGGDPKARPGNVVIDWPAGGCCRLQCTDVLNSNPGSTVWVDVPGTPPLNLPAGGPHRFYRLIAP